MTSRFFWFRVKEFILFFLSFIKRNDRFSYDWESLACCSDPCRTNNEEHDRYRGHGSSFGTGTDLDSEEVVACFQLAVRFFASLEDIYQVPVDCRVMKQDTMERNPYTNSIDLKLLYLPSWIEEVLECFVSQVSEYRDKIREHMWGDNVVLAGGMIHLENDDLRRGLDAITGLLSNQQACERTYMNLQDVLVFAPIVFRITNHGMKHSVRTKEKGDQLCNTIEKELNLFGFADGVIDIGFTLLGPYGRDWGISFTKIHGEL